MTMLLRSHIIALFLRRSNFLFFLSGIDMQAAQRKITYSMSTLYHNHNVSILQLVGVHIGPLTDASAY